MTSERESERASERASEQKERERQRKRETGAKNERSRERESVCVRVFVLCVYERSKPSGEKGSGEVRGSGYRDDERGREREQQRARETESQYV